MNRATSAAAFVLGLAFAGHALAQQPLKVGVLEDMSGFYADIAGPGSVLAAQMAVADFGGKVLGRPIEVVGADHQNKADIGAAIARQWYDVEKVGMITGLGNSSVALAVQGLAKERGMIDIVTSGGSSDLTGKACSPTGFHWVYDSYALAKTTAQAVVAAGGKSWFFLTANYAYGQAAQRDSSQFIAQAGGTVVGSVLVPPNSSDFSSYLLQAENSKAQVVGLASAGSDMSNAIKQASEFGLVEKGQTMAGLVVFITDVHALGLKASHGMYLTTAFYWDLNDKTREWSQRFFATRKAMPTMAQAGVYSATLHYLKAVKSARTDDPKAVSAAMRAMPISDFWSTDARIRDDGRVMRDMLLFKVKDPTDSKAPWDYYDLVSKVKPDDAFRPLSESDCPFIKK